MSKAIAITTAISVVVLLSGLLICFSARQPHVDTEASEREKADADLIKSIETHSGPIPMDAEEIHGPLYPFPPQQPHQHQSIHVE